MGSLCLSSLTVLRCAPLTRMENIALIIPPALEIIFSTSLIVTNWGMGWCVLLLWRELKRSRPIINILLRRHLLLTADSWSYLLLAIVDLFSHISPAARDHLRAFSAMDIVLGAWSDYRFTSLLMTLTRSLVVHPDLLLHALYLPLHACRAPPVLTSALSKHHQIHSRSFHTRRHCP